MLTEKKIKQARHPERKVREGANYYRITGGSSLGLPT